MYLENANLGPLGSVSGSLSTGSGGTSGSLSGNANLGPLGSASGSLNTGSGGTSGGASLNLGGSGSSQPSGSSTQGSGLGSGSPSSGSGSSGSGGSSSPMQMFQQMLTGGPNGFQQMMQNAQSSGGPIGKTYCTMHMFKIVTWKQRSICLLKIDIFIYKLLTLCLFP